MADQTRFEIIPDEALLKPNPHVEGDDVPRVGAGVGAGEGAVVGPGHRHTYVRGWSRDRTDVESVLINMREARLVETVRSYYLGLLTETNMHRWLIRLGSKSFPMKHY